ncbi:hypothetical protein QOZ66_31415, partial [Pseudomonas aeruginosa]
MAITTRAIISSIEMNPLLRLLLMVLSPQALPGLASLVVLQEMSLLSADLVAHGRAVVAGEQKWLGGQAARRTIALQRLADHRLDSFG